MNDLGRRKAQVIRIMGFVNCVTREDDGVAHLGCKQVIEETTAVLLLDISLASHVEGLQVVQICFCRDPCVVRMM